MTASSRPAFKRTRRRSEQLGSVALLDFLMGCSMSDVKQRYHLSSIHDTEALLRDEILRHGYAACEAEP
jgi:hypothetical protein